jgi:phosphonopyruvate decarboxylase
MGHAAQIALGIATQKPERAVWCIDGDGATIMHMGGLATVGWVAPKNFKHIVLNNMAHESVGGQPSAAGVINLPAIAKANGYAFVSTAKTVGDVGGALTKVAATPGPCFLEIIVNLESRKDLVRPAETPVENKKRFMEYLAHGSN